MPDLINNIRFYNFISGLLMQQQTDPLCRNCKAFENTARRMKEGLSELEKLVEGKTESVPSEILSMVEDTRTRLEGLNIPEGAEGQKKAGRCKLPKGVCFIKNPKAILDNIS
ncbi:MAG: hypothetical protein A2X59_08935 [Nitrospirae bacterium GWC2_42_7]|nr:MAG: hypothetical protein A2X59_08935 [Nitrospirae bacterium GWC2_42_7]